MLTLETYPDSRLTRSPRRAVYDHETLARLLDRADTRHADFLDNLYALEVLEARLGGPDWTDEDHDELIRLCHQIRNQMCCLMLAHDSPVTDEETAPHRIATLEALGRFAALIKGDHVTPPRSVSHFPGSSPSRSQP